MHVFYVLDTSGSMVGDSIAVLNRAVADTVEILKQQAENHADTKLEIAVLECNGKCRWIQPEGPEEIEGFCWVDLEAGGTTDLDEALRELNAKLSLQAFLNFATADYFPIIIFMTDGYDTSPPDRYHAALEEIRQNEWFAHAVKIGFAIGMEADYGVLAEITGDAGAVLRTNDLEAFAEWIHFVPVTASALNGTSEDGLEKIGGNGVAVDAGKGSEVPEEKKDPKGYPELFAEMTDLDLELDWEEWED